MVASRKKRLLGCLAVPGAFALIWLAGMAAAHDDDPKPQPPQDAKLQASDVSIIDLPSALNLAGVRNPHILLARERILEVTALHQLAAAQLLPSLHLGTSYDNHNGNLQRRQRRHPQRRSWLVLHRRRHAAVGAGTVTIPGVYFNQNVSEAIFKPLEARQLAKGRQFAERAAENDMLLRVALTYLQLVRAEGRRAIAVQDLTEARYVEQLLEKYYKAGQGRHADYGRANVERAHREAFLSETQGDAVLASATPGGTARSAAHAAPASQ